jgi:hypothetical protein
MNKKIEEKEIKLTYYQNNKEKLTEYSKNYYQKKKRNKYALNENITMKRDITLEFL